MGLFDGVYEQKPMSIDQLDLLQATRARVMELLERDFVEVWKTHPEYKGKFNHASADFNRAAGIMEGAVYWGILSPEQATEIFEEFKQEVREALLNRPKEHDV